MRGGAADARPPGVKHALPARGRPAAVTPHRAIAGGHGGARALALLAALACAAPLAAQDAPRGPTLLRVAASTGGIVLSLDSAAIARAGDSVFVVNAVYRFPADTARRGADGKMEMQAMDCGRTRSLGRWSAYFAGSVSLPIEDEAPDRPRTWVPVEDRELPVFQAICGYLLGSFAASLPVTAEDMALEAAPEVANRDEVAQALSGAYPRLLRDAEVSGTVMVRLQVTAEGRADPATVRVLWATRPQFAAAALQVVQRIRWRPATVEGRPVAAWVTLPVNFSLYR
jgi:protein TonB